ncbi:hypothetical protein Hanom_Chr14g01335871 [Helianthus anomalus]
MAINSGGYFINSDTLEKKIIFLYVHYIKIPWYICYFTCIFNRNLNSSYFIAILNCYLY